MGQKFTGNRQVDTNPRTFVMKVKFPKMYYRKKLCFLLWIPTQAPFSGFDFYLDIREESCKLFFPSLVLIILIIIKIIFIIVYPEFTTRIIPIENNILYQVIINLINTHERFFRNKVMDWTPIF